MGNRCHYQCTIFINTLEYILNHSILDAAHMYDDAMHYSQAAQDISGIYVAKMILTSIPNGLNELPPPKNSIVFDTVGVFDFSSINTEKNVAFKNSIVSTQALRLTQNDVIEIDIPGAPICIVFVSSQDAGSFQMNWGSDSAIVHTLHEGVREGKFAFLPLSAYGLWWNKAKQEKLRISVLPTFSGKADWPVFHVGPSAKDSRNIYLTKLLYRVSC